MMSSESVFQKEVPCDSFSTMDMMYYLFNPTQNFISLPLPHF